MSTAGQAICASGGYASLRRQKGRQIRYAFIGSGAAISFSVARGSDDVDFRHKGESASSWATCVGAPRRRRPAYPVPATVDAALDIDPGDRNGFAIADRLLVLGVSFLFATGYGEQAQIPTDHRDRIIVQKPYTLENVPRAMSELVGMTPTP